MYDNIAAKIKALAKWTVIIMSVIMEIAGLAMIIMAIVDGGSGVEEIVVPALIAMIVGPLLVWISSWPLYGFGEAIEKLGEISANTHRSVQLQGQVKTDNKK